jgi:hypothetical protein
MDSNGYGLRRAWCFSRLIMSLKFMAAYDRVPRGDSTPEDKMYAALHRSLFKKAKRMGRCAACQLRVRIKQDGHTYKHSGTGSHACAGSGHPPVNIEVSCPACGRVTAYATSNKRLNNHNIPGGELCGGGGIKILHTEGAVFFDS